MTKLTEDMVIARTKTSDLSTVKKFNCWGSDLDDVSLVRKLVNVEVLSLSLNKITTLADFQFCRNLTELYVRRNEIRDLCELCYLQDLPRLSRLLLSENPGVETAGPLYRATVLRCLPNLETLDNQAVTPDEVEAAARVGLILEHPLHRRERGSSPVEQPNCYYERESPPPSTVQQGNRRSLSQYDYEDESSSYRQNHSSGSIHSPDNQYQQNGGGNKSPEAGCGLTQVTNANANGNPNIQRPSQFPTTVTLPDQQQQDQRSQSPPTTSPVQGSLPRRQSGSPIIDCYQQQYRERDINGSRRQSVDYSGDTLRNYENYYDDPQHRQQVQVIPTQRHPPIPSNRTKPRTKTSNLLSAVLCLLPELDWGSLEVIEMAVRRRMDEIINN